MNRICLYFTLEPNQVAMKAAPGHKLPFPIVRRTTGVGGKAVLEGGPSAGFKLREGAPIMRYALADAEWCVIEPILPRKPRGVPRVAGPARGAGLSAGIRNGGRSRRATWGSGYCDGLTRLPAARGCSGCLLPRSPSLPVFPGSNVLLSKGTQSIDAAAIQSVSGGMGGTNPTLPGSGGSGDNGTIVNQQVA